MIPQRLQLSRKKGWRMPANTLKVDRTSQWGNPYMIGRPISGKAVRKWAFVIEATDVQAVDRAEAVQLFADLLFKDRNAQSKVKRALVGKHLACWCSLDGPCHADVLLQVANEVAYTIGG